VIDETMFEAEEKLEKAVAVAKDDFAHIRTGRATAAMFAAHGRLLRGPDADHQIRLPDPEARCSHLATTRARCRRSRRPSATPTSA
jgi:hypothetical protein